MVQLSDLLDAHVRTTDGRRLGRVGDVRVTQDADGHWQVSHLLIGKGSLLERLGLGSGDRHAIPWPEVRDITRGAILVSDAASPR